MCFLFMSVGHGLWEWGRGLWRLCNLKSHLGSQANSMVGLSQVFRLSANILDWVGHKAWGIFSPGPGGWKSKTKSPALIMGIVTIIKNQIKTKQNLHKQDSDLTAVGSICRGCVDSRAWALAIDGKQQLVHYCLQPERGSTVASLGWLPLPFMVPNYALRAKPYIGTQRECKVTPFNGIGMPSGAFGC